jgi:predicted dehydrogenase/threonine dehydrogenase-like Zn-dependent dehydrogenase
MKQVLYDKSGRVFVEDVPVPAVGRNQVLVKVEYSLLSAGTEKSMIELMKKPLIKMAIERKDLAKQVIDYAKEAGIASTIQLVRSRLDTWHLLGYSCAGTVEKGEGFSKGDRVACLGTGFANHAEFIAVPKTLVCRIPDGVSSKDASFGGVGAIAMESVRRLAPTLGETHVVIGMGLIGKLAAQILRANGCRVIGIDLDKSKAEKHSDYALTSPDAKEVYRLTQGLGADGVIIAASTKANLVNSSFALCRRRGRVVMLGVCDMAIDRAAMYEKELELRMSTAFGPGYYDPEYEQKGLDYPASDVRWTAGRNMQSFLELLAAGKAASGDYKVYGIDQAEEAYKELLSIGAVSLLNYHGKASRETTIHLSKSYRKGRMNAGLIGAGNFTKSFILPNLRKNGFGIAAVATKDGAHAKHVASTYGARYATTDYHRILKDKGIDLVIIGTRHDLHASMVADALKAGKHVFVEKPLAIFPEELDKLRPLVDRHHGILAVGFNRRYSPYMIKLKELISGKPVMIDYVFNNPELPRDHWVNQRDVGGGRFIGEACHIVDLFSFLAGSEPISISAEQAEGQGIIPGNNISAVIRYANGSVCTLVYSCMGNASVPKERCQVFDGSNVIVVENFKSLIVNGTRKYGGLKDEGHAGEFAELGKAVRGEKNCLITPKEGLLATETVFSIMRKVTNEDT